MRDYLYSLNDTEQEQLGWQFMLKARELVDNANCKFCLQYQEKTNVIDTCDTPTEELWLKLDETGAWSYTSGLPTVIYTTFDLYLPILTVHQQNHGFLVAHLGQSIDSQIATQTGDSFYVTGEENRKHLHCLRALCHAVVVGAGTVVADNPQLTTRAVPGANPLRVVIDPRAQLREPLKLFADSAARTVLLHQSSAEFSSLDMSFGPTIKSDTGEFVAQVERWVVPDTEDNMAVEKIVALLAERGLTRLFIEGGGITVSRFFQASLLDRLHIAVAPILVGSGTAAMQLPASNSMLEAHRPTKALYRMGEDVLWDFDLRSQINARDNEAKKSENASALEPPKRIG